jgi:hypothetical protein
MVNVTKKVNDDNNLILEGVFRLVKLEFRTLKNLCSTENTSMMVMISMKLYFEVFTGCN